MLTGPECKEKITVQLADVKQHDFLKRNQHAAFRKQKENLKENEILIHVDFSENYDNQQQHAIQSAYFGYDSYTLYTACVYFRPSLESAIKCNNFVLVTSANEHTRVVAYNLNEYLLDHAKNIHPFDTVHFWSDGCAAQFKSRYCFNQLTKFDDSLKVHWHYFESHHGKGAVDGLGSCVKNTVFRKVKSKQVVINSAKQFAEYGNSVVSGINVIYIGDECMVSKIDESGSKPVPGTLLVRCVERIVQDGKYTLNFYKSSPLDESQTEPFYALESIDELTNSNCATVTGTLNSVQVGEWYVVVMNTITGLLGLWSKFMMTYKWFSWNRNNQELTFSKTRQIIPV